MNNKFNQGDQVTHTCPVSGEKRPGRFIKYLDGENVAFVMFSVFTTNYTPTLSLNPDGNTMISGLLQGEFLEAMEVCSTEDLVHSQS